MSKPIAYEAYQKLAGAYAANIDTKPHNAYYDRPATLSLLPDIRQMRIFEAGCGPGAYTRELLDRGAEVVACDVSERMLDLARQRVGFDVDFRLLDLTQPLDMFSDESFDGVLAPLCLDYIEDWKTLFCEFQRMLKPGGFFVFSCGHPEFDAKYYNTNNYFSVERVESEWTGFGVDVMMPGYRRPWTALLNPIIDAGLQIERVHEPQPTEDFKLADPIRYKSLMHRPGFACVKARKPNNS